MISPLKRLLSHRQFSRTLLTVCLLTILLAISSCSKENKSQESLKEYHQSSTLLTISPEQSYLIERDYLGQIAAKQQTNLNFEYAGKVSKVFVDIGDIVEKGQLLAQQDTQLLGYKTAELQAQIEQSEAQKSLNIANLSRIQSLISNGYSSKQRLDELDTENTIIKAKINALNARIDTLEYQREKSTLKAPFDGVITKRFISNGAVISPSTPSFHIIENANNEINVGIPSKIARALSLGQLIEVKVGEHEKQAKLIAIGNQINTVNRTVQLRLKVLEKLDNVKSFNGQLVRITIDQKISKAGFWIPIDAITDGVRGQWQIFTASKSPDSQDIYQLHAATVKILHANENSVYVSGLKIKEHQIVSQGVHRYVSGQKVAKSPEKMVEMETSH